MLMEEECEQLSDQWFDAAEEGKFNFFLGLHPKNRQNSAIQKNKTNKIMILSKQNIIKQLKKYLG